MITEVVFDNNPGVSRRREEEEEQKRKKCYQILFLSNYKIKKMIKIIF